MRRLAALAVLGLLAAGCGGSKQAEAPTTALLTGVDVAATSVTFAFRSGPRDVKVSYRPRAQIVESGSGARVRVAGTAFLVIRFTPAATADLQGEKVVPTYTGPKHVRGPGPVREAAKISDFEADLGWAIGLDRRLPYDVARDGDRVTVTFGG
jgi:hypothetical protein